jgi:hypothetical protein
LTKRAALACSAEAAFFGKEEINWILMRKCLHIGTFCAMQVIENK